MIGGCGGGPELDGGIPPMENCPGEGPSMNPPGFEGSPEEE